MLLRTIMPVGWLVTIVSVSSATAGTLQTKEGGVFTGDLALDESGQVVVSPATAGGVPLRFALSGVRKATFVPPSTGLLSGGTLPGNWLVRDVGDLGVGGSSEYDRGSFILTGAGAGLAGKSDAFHLVYQKLPADGQIIAHVGEFEASDPDAMAGVMIRGSATSDARFAAMAITAGRGAKFLTRPAFGELVTAAGIPEGAKLKAPCWVKLVKIGNSIIASQSTDRRRWQVVSRMAAENFGDSVVGLFVTSHQGFRPARAEFDGVQMAAHGARVEYYSDNAFGELKTSRAEPWIVFQPGFTGPAVPDLGDSYSIRWTAQLEAPSTDQYTFRLQTTGGARLWINGHLCYDSKNPKHHDGIAALRAGQRYDLQVDYVAAAGEPVCNLMWVTPGEASVALVPRDVLYVPPDSRPVTAAMNAGLFASGTAPARGILLKDGTFLPGDVKSADDKAIVFLLRGEVELPIATATVSRIQFRAMTPPALAKLAGRPAGVLNGDGDYVEGEPRSIIGGHLKLNSVVFGVVGMETRSEVVAAVYADVQQGATPVVVQTSGGGIIAASALHRDPKTGKIVIDEPLLGPVSIATGDLLAVESAAP